MNRSISALLSCVLIITSVALAGVESDKAIYVGGTATLKMGTEAVLDTSSETVVKFDTWQTPYDKITALDYGQHVGHHWALVALGLYGVVPLLIAKKRRHYLTVEYSGDDGKSQAAIFEVGKDSIRSTLKVLEVRSGRKIQYEDKDAEKAGNK